MKIYPITPFVKNNINNTPKNKQKTEVQQTSNNKFLTGYNDYLLSFEARVDKGLERFYDTNKDRMPVIVRNYIEQLDDKSRITPMEAQKQAFELLEISQSIEDIQSAYPADEEQQIFSDLKNPSETKAKRGILNSIRENNELLDLYDMGVLKDKSNLTVYLVKKIYLENKTIAEINEDLEKDLNEDFKTDFKSNNPDSRYIYPSTLTSLGIKVPDAEYRQSLRYTVDGYSDYVGGKISDFWNNLSMEERTARNKKSVEKFETWWTSLTRNEILDMLAQDADEIEMLKKFKKYGRAEAKKSAAEQPQENEQKPKTPRKHIKVGSTVLSQDEFFKKWAANKLKIYQLQMSEAEKDSLHIRRMQALVSRWAEMSPVERTDYISKMKAGSEPLKYTMIDAWNHSMDLIKDLSTHLKENQIYKPADLLYSTQEFSEFQSAVMSEFWEKNPQHADKLGYNIRQSQIKVQTAIARGTFEELKREILRDKNQRIKEIARFKSENIQKPQAIEETGTPDYMKEFKNAYTSVLGGQLKNLPPAYINEYFKVVENDFTQAQVEAWTKNLKGLPISEEEKELLLQISRTESEDGARINRALEGALAATLFECTQNPEVYKLSFSDLKVALHQVDRGEPKIIIGSHKLNTQFEFPIIKRKIDKHKIAAQYNSFIEPLKEDKLEQIIRDYFVTTDRESLIEYLRTYGKTLNIIFSDKSVHSTQIKTNMLEKLKQNAPAEVIKNSKCLINGEMGFEKEDKIKHIKFLIEKRFNFIPNIFMEKYLSELGHNLRLSTSMEVSYDQMLVAGQKRTDIKAMQRLLILPKNEFSVSNALSSLAMEEVLADVLYEATGNDEVYGLQFEELCDNIELFGLAKKFPTDTRSYTSQNGKYIELAANKRPNLYGLQQKYLDYRNEIADWVNADVKNGNGTLEDLVCILNPDENMPQKDKLVEERINRYGLNLK